MTVEELIAKAPESCVYKLTDTAKYLIICDVRVVTDLEAVKAIGEELRALGIHAIILIVQDPANTIRLLELTP